jgi:hypothetical protein
MTPAERLNASQPPIGAEPMLHRGCGGEIVPDPTSAGYSFNAEQGYAYATWGPFQPRYLCLRCKAEILGDAEIEFLGEPYPPPPSPDDFAGNINIPFTESSRCTLPGCPNSCGPTAGSKGGKPYCSAHCRSKHWQQLHVRHVHRTSRRPRPCRAGRLDLYLSPQHRATLERYMKTWGLASLSAALRWLLEGEARALDASDRAMDEAEKAGLV